MKIEEFSENNGIELKVKNCEMSTIGTLMHVKYFE